MNERENGKYFKKPNVFSAVATNNILNLNGGWGCRYGTANEVANADILIGTFPPPSSRTPFLYGGCRTTVPPYRHPG